MLSRTQPIQVIAAIALMISSGALADTQYEFTLVDAFTPNYALRETYIYDINDQNLAVGTTTITIQLPNGSSTTTYTGFYWTPETEKAAVELSWPKGVNNGGLMAGSLQTYDIPTDQFTNMPLLPSTFPPLVLLGVNDGGVAVGYVQICNCSNSQGTLQIPYVWDAANGARSLSVPNAKGAARINSNGLIVGWTGSWSMPDSYMYNLNANTYTIMSTQFAEPNAQTTAVDVNDNNVVVGWRKNSTGSISWGYTWTPGESPTLLPLPPEGFQPHLRPTSINNDGVIVGSIYTPIATQLAFVYDAEHGVRELSTLTNEPAGFTLMTATAINDNGWIVGYGYGGGGMYKSFVLQPIVPVMGDATGDGLVNVNDLLAVISAWGTCPLPPATCPADLNGNGAVGIDDLLIVINNWTGI
ncbi:MAG: DUF3466 family protein [Phycisphaerales bacterium]|nr:DUF3466 family protein [Phycisphaerales bacterium]